MRTPLPSAREFANAVRSVRRPFTRAHLAAACFLALGACAGADAPPAAIVRDSAGVTIVENGPVERAAPIAVDPEPAVSIGMLDGPPEYTFRTIGDVDRMPDGRILVADVDEIRLYDANGKHLVTAGGAGEGPGEFVRVRAAVPCGAEIVVGDFRQARLTYFDPAGAFVRTVPLPVPSGQFFPFLLEACDDAGRPLLRSPSVIVEGEGADARATIPVVRLDPGTATVDTVLRAPSTEPVGGGVSSSFARSTLLAFRDSLIYVVGTGALEVRTFGPDGALRRVARVPASPRPVTGADVARDIDERVEGFPEEFRARLRAELEKATPPETMPVVARFRVDAIGRAWIQRYRPRWEEPDTVWTVLAADGQALGTVALPAGLMVQAIGEDWLLGVWRDELDVSYVRLHRIVPAVEH